MARGACLGVWRAFVPGPDGRGVNPWAETGRSRPAAGGPAFPAGGVGGLRWCRDVDCVGRVARRRAGVRARAGQARVNPSPVTGRSRPARVGQLARSGGGGLRWCRDADCAGRESRPAAGVSARIGTGAGRTHRLTRAGADRRRVGQLSRSGSRRVSGHSSRGSLRDPRAGRASRHTAGVRAQGQSRGATPSADTGRSPLATSGPTYPSGEAGMPRRGRDADRAESSRAARVSTYRCRSCPGSIGPQRPADRRVRRAGPHRRVGHDKTGGARRRRGDGRAVARGAERDRRPGTARQRPAG